MLSNVSPAADFLNSIFAAYDGDLTFDLDGELLIGSDRAFLQQHLGKLRVSPITNGGSCFVFRIRENSAPEAFEGSDFQPTAQLRKGGELIDVYAFDAPQNDTDDLNALGEALGMSDVTEIVPLPGTDGWELTHHSGPLHSLADMRAEYVNAPEATEADVAESEPTAGPEGAAEVASGASGIKNKIAAGDTYGSAICMTDYDETAHSKEMVVSLGANKFAQDWKPVTIPVGQLIAWCCQPKVGKKDGRAFMPADALPGQRKKGTVKRIYAAVLDLDTGVPTVRVDEVLKALGCLALRYPTHSHNKTESDFNQDTIKKFAGGREINDELIRCYLREKEKWDPSVADHAQIIREGLNEKGPTFCIGHPKMPKHRIVIPFDEAFDIIEEAKVSMHADALRKWEKVLEALARRLEVPFDKSCTDPSRLFYFPRHPHGQSPKASLFDGPYFDWRTLGLDNPLDRLAAAVSKGKSKSVTDKGKELGRWSLKRAHGFQIADVIDANAPDRIRHNTGRGYEIECPFDEDHSNAGDQEDRACLVVNAGEGPSEFFTISCRHETCRDKTNLDMLGKMIKDGWFTKDVLEDEQFNAILEDDQKPEAPANAGGSAPEKQSFNFHDEETLVTELDSMCRVVALGGKRRFAFLGREQEPQFLTQSDAAIELAQYKLWKNKGTEKEPDWVSQPAFNVWLGSSMRKPNFSAARFDPKLKTGDVGNGLLNLWTGLAVDPAPGDWSLLRTHIWENICRENEEHFAFLMGWMAQLFQQPGRKNGVAIVLRGDIGVGKTKLPEWISNVIGDRHAITADKSEQCTGKFNAALEMNIFISAEEAFFAGDPRQAGPLKHLITGHKMMYEPKGRDSYMGMNYSRLMMTTNVKWAVPAVARERRYLVLDVSPKRQKQKAYFKAIDDQMEAGGAAAMLHDLLAYDFSEIDFQNPPITDALKDIIQRGIDSSEKWLVSVLTEGRFPCRGEFGQSEAEWNKDGAEIAKATIVASYNDFVPSYRKTPADAQDVQLFLRERIGSLTSTKPTVGEGRLKKREPSWKLPPLDAARKAYSDATGYVFEAEE